MDKRKSINFSMIMGIILFACQTPQTTVETEPIKVYRNNPFYWEYNGKPVLLIGGSREDNLFNHPEGLEEHLDLLKSVGGNYVRNTMSSRNPGNPWAFKKLENGLYDLNQWNDEYWERFSKTGEHPQWGQYWARFIRQKANEKGKEVYLADMRYNTNLQAEDHRKLLHDRENFDFFEISQNNNNVNDQLHYDRFQEIRNQIVDNPKPLNNIKIYGGEPYWTTSPEEGTRRFWRNIFGGAASVRFHREGPSSHFFGIGLSELAQTHIKSARTFTDSFHIFTCQPSNHLLSNRNDNEAYCIAEEGRQYAVYFPDGGEVDIDLSIATGEWNMRGLDILESEWQAATTVSGGSNITLTAPGGGQWVILIVPSD